jgi:hypothetical protein
MRSSYFHSLQKIETDSGPLGRAERMKYFLLVSLGSVKALSLLGPWKSTAALILVDVVQWFLVFAE